ncbi:MAG: nicotinamide mononucleotide transporter [Gammaproteobacteria bacterium]|nr:nicotinamide mononucleotide transporter [Gammaproteobacteria bacterium]
MSPLEIAAVLFAIAYLLLVIRENVLCWPAALIGVLLSLIVFYDAKLYMESALQVFYAGMAIYGWYQWSHGGRRGEGVAIRVWPWQLHAIAIGGTIAVSAAAGSIMSAYTDAAYPYLDSFTTIAALVTTYMVAKKVLENWIYWFVIDGVSVYLYGARGLFLFAGLFVGYLVLIVIGFRAWRRQWNAERSGAIAQGAAEEAARA